MAESLVFEDLDFLLEREELPQNEVSAELPAANRESTKKRRRLAERIAETDELVRQLKQLQDNEKQLKDLQRTAGEVTKLYQHEKEQRVELERRLNEQTERCVELEKQLDVQQLNCEQLQEQLSTKALPVDAKDMVTIFMQLTQRLDEDSHASDLLRRVQKLRRKLKDYCKTANISMPTIRSPTSKRSKTATICTQTTQTNPLQDSVPKMCSIAVQSENLVTTRNQGTQHKNTTTTRGTTTASFIKKHDVGTCFPEPKPALSAQQILDKMLSWNNSFITPLSPISDPQTDAEVVETVCMGTCTDLCNVLREIDYLPELPTELKRSNSRPPSRASVKDELAMPVGGGTTTPASCGYGHHMAKELLHFLPQSQSILTNLPPHVFEEIWQVMGQMVLVVLQRRSTSSSLATPKPTTPLPIINQADFGSWFDALYESSINPQQTSNKEDADFDLPAEEQTTTDMGTDPISMPPPPEIGLELTPIRLLAKPKFRVVSKPKPKRKPMKKKRRIIRKKREKTVADNAAPTETAVQFLSNLNTFKNPNCDIMDIELDAEERQLLELTKASENIDEQSVEASDKIEEQSTAALENVAKQLPAASVEHETDSLHSTDQQSSCTDRIQLLFGSDEDSDVEQTEEEAANLQIPPTQYSQQDQTKENEQAPPKDEEDTEITATFSLNKDQMTSKDWNDDKRPPLETEALPKPITQTTSFHEDQMKLLFNDVEPLLTKDKDKPLSAQEPNVSIEDSPQSSPTISPCNDLNKLLIASDLEEEQCQLSKEQLPVQTDGNISDVDSIDSHCLIIDDGNLQCDIKSDHQAIKETVGVTESILTLPVTKRKRKSSSCSSSEQQPVEKRLTRSQAKQMLLEGKAIPKTDNLESNKVTKETQFSCSISDSPMSPVAVSNCEESDRDPIEIPLEQPGEGYKASEPKALLSYIVNEVKTEAKQRNQRNQPTNKTQMEQLQLKLVNYLKDSTPLDLNCIQLIIGGETAAMDVLIAAFREIEEESAMERVLILSKQIECQNVCFIARLMIALEQRLFSIKERLAGPLAQKYLRLYLQLTSLQATLTVPGQRYVNPARLLIAKILYHYNMDISLLVLEVLRYYPTVLPHREERDYDNADALITVIKHLLMSYKYEMHDVQGPDRALLSKLRFEYHFQPFEPTKQQVIENLVEKLKAGRLHQLSYAFALFCRRSDAQLVTKGVVEQQLLPLANSYCDLCVQDTSYDARVECLLQCVSMIVKQLPLDNKVDITNCIAVFKRLLVAVPRPGVQQAVVQAILRTQRFGYGFALEALHGYRPNYPLNPMTRAMMRSFAERRQQFQPRKKVVHNKQQTIS